jgi:hypothetical protein
MSYFSDTVKGEQPRDREEIGEVAWGGIRALLNARIEDGSFGARYPETCPDGSGPIGTAANSFWEAMRGEIPTLGELPPWYTAVDLPSTLNILDLIQFAWRSVGKPIQRDYHPYFKHYHLDYDRQAGRAEFREDVNRILHRNGLAYDMTPDGQVERLAPPMLREELISAEFNTGDAELNQMLETARRKFLDPDPAVRREALEKLWDAWERLKTMGSGANKKVQANDILDHAAGVSSGKFRQALENEAKELTSIGNNLQIRHSEVTQEPLGASTHVDYLFHRLVALVLLILRTGKLNT